MGNEGAKAIAAALGKLKNLTSLTIKLSGNDISNEGAKAIAAALGELKNLTSLTIKLCYNEIGNEGAIAIAQALLELKNLISLNLDLQHNHAIDTQGAEEIKGILSRSLGNLSLWSVLI